MSGDQLDLDAVFRRSLRVAEAAPVKYEWHAQSDIAILLEVDVPALHQEVRRLRAKVERVEAAVSDNGPRTMMLADDVRAALEDS